MVSTEKKEELFALKVISKQQIEDLNLTKTIVSEKNILDMISFTLIL